MKPYLHLFDFSRKVDYRIEILAGLTVAMTMMPESLSSLFSPAFRRW
jgi:SulP family sulfate permease